jgi:hypothetical protein
MRLCDIGYWKRSQNLWDGHQRLCRSEKMHARSGAYAASVGGIQRARDDRVTTVKKLSPLILAILRAAPDCRLSARRPF